MKYYASAGFKTLSFFLILPIATHYLSKSEVGLFFFWVAIVQLGAGISTLGFSSSIARKSYNRKTIDYVAGVGTLVSFGGWLLIAACGLAIGALSGIVVIAWIARSASMLGEARTIARGEVRKLSSIYFAYALALPAACMAAIFSFRASYESLLFGYAVAESLVAIAGLHAIRFRFRKELGHARRKFANAIIHSSRYGMPLMFAGIANLGLNSADRFIVAGFWNFEMVGEFSIMYTIAFASNRFITAPANMKIFPEFVRGRSDTVAMARVHDVAGYAWLASIGYGMFVAVMGPLIVRYALSADYAIARADFALVAAAAALFLLFTINSSHLKLRNQTSKMMVLLFIALGINVAISVILVPRLGYRGAVISTFVTYLCLAAWTIIRLRPTLIRKNALVAGGIVIVATIFWTLLE